ncbi:unnamed protein product [Bursaphelenchus xylophilus]|uniref:Acyl carrier protein n=1 Tax=Bursaphelenchus xylophilus TaxID=6326 RepID=A0A1I7SWQ2_BURXY|nr:unnamed protein product [Bursaphelenchus xylophilus]CAG9099793.1 unnamed protein product [Bursaphelenchus xylophilus]
MFRLIPRSRTLLSLPKRCVAISQPGFSHIPAMLSTPLHSNFTSKHYSTVSTFGGTAEPPKQLTIKEVEEKVIKAIKAWDRFPQDRVDKLTLEARFVEDLGFDSLDLVEITMALEDEFGFEIPEGDVDKLKTPRDIQKYVCEHEDIFE